MDLEPTQPATPPEKKQVSGHIQKGPFMLNLLDFSAAFRKENRGKELCQGRAMLALMSLRV